MQRFIQRPPLLQLATSFGAAYEAGRFQQRELDTQSALLSEAKNYDIGFALDDDALESLDRYGVFTPIAFAPKDSAGWYGGPRWKPDALIWRDEVGFQPWSRYRYREEHARRVTALYSPWQLMYLGNAITEQMITLPLPLLLGRRERIDRVIWHQLRRKMWRVDRDFWLRLEHHWRPTVLLLSWLQNRYLPFVTGTSTMTHDPSTGELVDPVREEVRNFNAHQLLVDLGISVDDVRLVYRQLAFIGDVRDPLKDWYLVVRAASPEARKKFRGDARLAQLIYDAAEMVRRFLYDLTGVVEPDCDEVGAWPQDWKERLLGHERRLTYDRDDFKRILERNHLSPYGVHVFVEGASDEMLIAGIVDGIWGDHRALGIRFTVLHGVDQLERHRALVDAFSTYARKALLVADAEGKIERDLERLRNEGLLVDEDSFWPWNRNIEEDSASLAELVTIANQVCAGRGDDLGLTVQKLSRIRESAGERQSATSRIVGYAKQRRVRLSKEEIADELCSLILEEATSGEPEQELVRRRPVFGLALAIGRYSIRA